MQELNKLKQQVAEFQCTMLSQGELFVALNKINDLGLKNNVDLLDIYTNIDRAKSELTRIQYAIMKTQEEMDKNK